MKQQDFRVVLISMKANTRMGEHRADGRISIQTPHGLVYPTIELSAVQLLSLDCGRHYEVESLEEGCNEPLSQLNERFIVTCPHSRHCTRETKASSSG